MPKPTKGPRLGGSSSHQQALLANLATSLFEHGRITTTEPKARAAAEAKAKEDAELRAQAEEAATKRRAAEAKARADEEAKQGGRAAKPLAPELEKGVRGLVR